MICEVRRHGEHQERLERIKSACRHTMMQNWAVLQGQEYRIGTRTLRRPILCRYKNINEWSRKYTSQASGSFMSSKGVVLRDI